MLKRGKSKNKSKKLKNVTMMMIIVNIVISVVCKIHGFVEIMKATPYNMMTHR